MEAPLRWTDPSAREVWRRAQQQSPHLRDMLQYGLVTEDFAGAIPDLLRSVVFLDHFYGFWDPETRGNRDVSYVVFTPHPHLAADPDRLLASGEVLVAHRFWIAGSTGLSGQDIVHTLVSAPPDPLRPPDAIRAVARYSKGGRRYVGDTPMRTPPVRDLVVFDDRDLADTIRRGGVPPFRKGRLTVVPSPSGGREQTLGVVRWADYPGVAPPGPLGTVKREPREHAVTHREIPPRELLPQFPGLALEAGPYDPSYRIRDTIRVLTPDDQFSAVLSTMKLWSKWLGGPKVPPLGLLRALVYFMAQRQARVTGEQDVSLELAADLVLGYRPLLAQSPILRDMVARDMILFDELGELGALMRHGNIQRDLVSLWHALLPPDAGRFLVLVTRVNRPLGDPRSLYRVIIHVSRLEDASDIELLDREAIRPEQVPQGIAEIAAPEAGLLRRTTHLLGFGNPRRGPLFATRQQVYRIARLYTEEDQRATGQLTAPWTYYEGGSEAEPLTTLYE